MNICKTVEIQLFTKSVYSMFGSSFTLDYARSKATYNHSSGKWVMSSVGVDDGANMRTEFDYFPVARTRNKIIPEIKLSGISLKN